MYLTGDSAGWCLWNGKPMLDKTGVYVNDPSCVCPDTYYSIAGIIPGPKGFKVPKGGHGMWKVKLSNLGRVKA